MTSMLKYLKNMLPFSKNALLLKLEGQTVVDVGNLERFLDMWMEGYADLHQKPGDAVDCSTVKSTSAIRIILT